MYDNHNLEGQFQELRALLAEAEVDFYKFIGKNKNDKAATRARILLNEIRKRIRPLRESIQKQRQDNQSVY
jgi:hypothetical protein